MAELILRRRSDKESRSSWGPPIVGGYIVEVMPSFAEEAGKDPSAFCVSATAIGERAVLPSLRGAYASCMANSASQRSAETARPRRSREEGVLPLLRQFLGTAIW